MKIWEKIVNDAGLDVLDAILTVYVNFYYAELEIVGLCAKWIPRRNIIEEKFMLVEHASDEVKHSRLFKKGVENLGLVWDELDHGKYRLKDVNSRFGQLAQSNDEMDVLIGLNLYAEGVLAMEELVQLYHNKPDFFAVFKDIIPDEAKHLKFGLTVAKRLLAESPENFNKAQKLCDFYADHIRQYLWTEISPKIDEGIKYGYLSEDYRKKSLVRFGNVMSSVGLKTQTSL